MGSQIYYLKFEGSNYQFWEIDGSILLRSWYRSKNDCLTLQEINGIEITQHPSRGTPCNSYDGYYVPDTIIKGKEMEMKYYSVVTKTEVIAIEGTSCLVDEGILYIIGQDNIFVAAFKEWGHYFVSDEKPFQDKEGE